MMIALYMTLYCPINTCQNHRNAFGLLN